MVSEDMAVGNQVRKPDPPLGDFKLRTGPPAGTSSVHTHRSVHVVLLHAGILGPHFVVYVSAYLVLHPFYACAS